MSLEHMQAYVITKRSSNFNYNLRVDVQIPALNINHPAGHLLPRPVHHDHYHVHDHNMTVLRPLSRPLSNVRCNLNGTFNQPHYICRRLGLNAIVGRTVMSQLLHECEKFGTRHDLKYKQSINQFILLRINYILTSHQKTVI